jgi:hypothetical protein
MIFSSPFEVLNMKINLFHHRGHRGTQRGCKLVPLNESSDAILEVPNMEINQ